MEAGILAKADGEILGTIPAPKPIYQAQWDSQSLVHQSLWIYTGIEAWWTLGQFLEGCANQNTTLHDKKRKLFPLGPHQSFFPIRNACQAC